MSRIHEVDESEQLAEQLRAQFEAESKETEPTDTQATQEMDDVLAALASAMRETAQPPEQAPKKGKHKQKRQKKASQIPAAVTTAEGSEETDKEAPITQEPPAPAIEPEPPVAPQTDAEIDTQTEPSPKEPETTQTPPPPMPEVTAQVSALPQESAAVTPPVEEELGKGAGEVPVAELPAKKPVPPKKAAKKAAPAPSVAAEPKRAFHKNAPRTSKTAQQEQTQPVRSATEEAAEQAVASLLQDIFGRHDETVGSAPKEEKSAPKAGTVAPTEEIVPIPTPSEQAPVPTVAAENETAEPTAKGAPLDTAQPDSDAAEPFTFLAPTVEIVPQKKRPRRTPKRTAKGSEERAADADAETTTTKDGQISLVLPETGVLQAQEGTYTRARTMGGMLFSAVVVENATEPPERKVPSVGAVTGERIALKQSLEASEEDFKMLLDLDYEDELGTAIGFDKIRAYRELGVNGQEISARRRRRRAGDMSTYDLPGQDIAIRKSYAAKKKMHIFRLAATLVLMLVLLLYERPQLMASMTRGLFDGARYPVSYILFSLQLLLIDAAVCYKHLFDGLRRLLHFSPIDYSLCSVTVTVTFIYHIVLLFLPHTGAPALYLSPAAASIAILAAADLLDWYRESVAFQVIASKRQKFALIPRVSVGGRENNGREILKRTDSQGRTWYARPVGFVRNYSANTEKRVEHNSSLGSEVLLVAAVGIALGLYTQNLGGGFKGLLLSSFLTFLLCLPSVSLLVTSLPMFFATRLRLGRKGAIIGEEPVYQSGDSTSLVLADSEIFAPMGHEKFELVRGCDVSRSLSLIRALLDKVQSPFAESVGVDADARIPVGEVTLTEIDEDGVAAVIGREKTPILMGSMAYLGKYGIRLRPRDEAEHDEVCHRMCCVAIDGKVTALFLPRYRIIPEAVTLIELLQAEHVRVTVRTKDPGITKELFERLLPDLEEEIAVMKPTANELDIRTDRVDATIVAIGSARAAARVFVTCRRIRKAGTFGKALQILSLVVGAGISALLAFSHRLITISPFTITMYMLVWSAVQAIGSYLFLREKNHS